MASELAWPGALARAHARFRRTGADLPFGDPCGYHGTALEGYFWRLAVPEQDAVIIVMASVNRDRAGRSWGTVGLAAHPGVPAHMVAADSATGTRRGIGVALHHAGRRLFHASDTELDIDLAPGMRLQASIRDAVPWRRRSLGGVGIAHLVPGLSQYWHPYTLGARVTGDAVLAGRRVALDGGVLYAEKNWGPGGFPSQWWWGQSHTFGDPEVCAAFAGGRVGLGRLRMTATAVVARVGSRVLSAVHPLPPVRAELGRGRWLIGARTARHSILIEGDANGTRPHRLPIPVADARQQVPGAAAQHLAARMELTVRRGPRLVYRGESSLAGLERGGA